jgi:hypothetical protein
MNSKQKRQLENELLVMGLARLDDPELIQQLAELVSNWPGDKHDFLRDLLNECDADKRYEMYHAIAPKLRFKPLLLTQYEDQIAEKAGAMVSQGRMRVEGSAPKPVEINGHQLHITDQAHADCGWAVVCCHVCGKREKFLGETPVDAMTKARKTGWVRNVDLSEETCPECLPVGEPCLASSKTN